MIDPEIEELRERLREAEEAIRAISRGEVDAVMVESSAGPQVYTLRGADHSYRVMVEQMNQAAVSMTRDGIILFCNARFAELVGRRREAVIATRMEDLIPEGEVRSFRSLVSRALHGRAQGELSLKAGSDTVQTYASVNSLPFETERVVCLVLTDLSEQRRNEEIVAAGRLATAILQQVAEATVVCDRSGRIIQASRSAAELCGREPLQEHFEEVFPLEWGGPDVGCTPTEAAGTRFGFSEMTRVPLSRGTEMRFCRRDGRRFHVLLSAAEVKRAGGETLAWVLTLVDITTRKEVESLLFQAKQQAEATSRAKSDFLARMSHELRTPMNGVMGMTELALMENPPPKAREYLALAKQSAKTLLDIIDDLLDLSKIEAGRTDIASLPFNLREAVTSTLRTLGLAAARKGLRLTEDLDPELPVSVLGDEARLCQVLVNLVGNAIKFTAQGEVVLAARAGSTASRDRTRVLFTVRDTGIGIPAERLPTVFERFSPATTATHAKYGGTGLGLSIAKHLIELMGGRIWAESEIGTGSTFHFEIEFALPDQEGADLPEELSAARPAEGGLKILLAEDNEVNRILGIELLRRLGHTVADASNGREALDLLAREPFDLVLMDVQMPLMDGLEATREIREGRVPNCPARLPVVGVTAHALRGDRERFLAAGMDDYLSKPFSPEALKDVLRRFL